MPTQRKTRRTPRVAAVRGAIQVAANDAALIRDATARLLERLLAQNHLTPAHIVSAIFTATPDLTADFPAHAARRLGWTDVPLLGATEVDVPGALPRVVRVLLTVEIEAPDGPSPRLAPVYLDGAEALRPDLAAGGGAASRTNVRAGAGSGTGAGAARGKRRRVALIGLGQIGGSIGLALAGGGEWERVGFDRSVATARAARAAGAVDLIADSLTVACAGAELAVVAVPVDALPDVLARVAHALPKGAALVDTGSSRRGAQAALAAIAGRGIHVVGGHPIAGNEGRGFGSARADLFRGATFALLPLRGSAAPAIVRRLVRDLGAVPRIVPARAHDRALARTSHLPYLVSLAIAQQGSAPARQGLSGPGFATMTRLARMDPRMADAFCRDNAAEIERAWRELSGAIERSVRRLASPGPGRRARGSARGPRR
jgi:monofunctional chorismate mutase